MKRLGKSSRLVPAAGLLIFLVIGFAGRAFGDTTAKFVYVTNSGLPASGDEFGIFQVTATDVCTSRPCASTVAISGTFTLDLNTGHVINGSMSMSDPADIKSSPITLPFSSVGTFPENMYLFFRRPVDTNPLSYVELIFPFSTFSSTYTGGPLCTSTMIAGCGVFSGAEIGVNDVLVSGAGATNGELSTGSVTLTGTYGGSQESSGVSGYAVDITTGALTPVPGSPFAAGSEPYSVVVDPSNRFVYVANRNSNDVSAFRLNSATGALTPVPGSPFAAGSDPISLAVDPSDKFVYVANQNSNNVSAYSLNETTGALTQVSGSPFATQPGPISVAVHPAGKFIYVTNRNSAGLSGVSAYTIDSATGALGALSGSPYPVGNPVMAALDPAGKFLFEICNFAYNTPNGVLNYTINSATGALTAGSTQVYNLASATSAVVDPSGRFLYVTDGGYFDLDIYQIDNTTGTLTPNVWFFYHTDHYPNSVAIDSSGQFAYVANLGSNDISAYSIVVDPFLTPLLTPIPGSPFAAGAGPSSVAIAGPSTGPSSTPFETFKANLDIDEDRKTTFRVEGFFTLGAGSTGLDPVTETLEFQVGTYLVTVPAGSFKEIGRHGFERMKNRRSYEFQYDGEIDGVDLEIEIYRVKDNDYLFTAEGRGNILAGIKNPVTVGLTIGEFEGTTTVRARIDR